MNLWKETIEILNENGKKWEDVIKICGENFCISKSNFEELARKTNYDCGYGSQKVALDLQIFGKDWWLERGEYDGSEWWRYVETGIADDIPEVVVKTLCCGYGNDRVGWRTLAELNGMKEVEVNVE